METLRYKNDTIKDGSARVIVCCPQVGRPMEQLVVGGDTIIIGAQRSLKLASKRKIIPVGYDKRPLCKRLVNLF